MRKRGPQGDRTVVALHRLVVAIPRVQRVAAVVVRVRVGGVARERAVVVGQGSLHVAGFERAIRANPKDDAQLATRLHIAGILRQGARQHVDGVPGAAELGRNHTSQAQRRQVRRVACEQDPAYVGSGGEVARLRRGERASYGVGCVAQRSPLRYGFISACG